MLSFFRTSPGLIKVSICKHLWDLLDKKYPYHLGCASAAHLCFSNSLRFYEKLFKT